MTAPKAPEGLQAAGRRFWRANVDAETSVDRRRLVEAAARTLDDLDVLQAALVDASATVPGSMGQVRPNPLFAEVRQHRTLLARLLAQLAPRSAAATSEAARKAVRARWEKSGVARPIEIDRFRRTSPTVDDMKDLYDL